MATATLSFGPSSLLTAQQTAELLGVNAGTLAVWRCTRRYDLPYVKCGRSVRYRLADIEAFIESRTIGGDTSSN